MHRIYFYSRMQKLIIFFVLFYEITAFTSILIIKSKCKRNDDFFFIISLIKCMEIDASFFLSVFLFFCFLVFLFFCLVMSQPKANAYDVRTFAIPHRQRQRTVKAGFYNKHLLFSVW